MANVVGIIGSYRSDRVTSSLVKEILDLVADEGCETELIHLKDKHIEFCTNCRVCTQISGVTPARCVINDDMNSILKSISNADAIVIGAPVNFFSLNALTKKFMERLLVYTYWPWGRSTGPRLRNYKRQKYSVLISSSAMPGIVGRIFAGSMKSLRIISRILGAKPVKTIFAGMSAINESDKASPRALKSAREAGYKLLLQISNKG